MRISALDTETPVGNIALLCTPSESYNIATWEDFTSKFMVRKNLKTIYFTWNLRYDAQAILKLLPYDELIKVWKEKKIEYKGYRITYIPSKLLRISKIESKQGAVHLYDCSQYYGHASLNSMAEKYLNEKKLETVSGEEIGKSRKYYDENYVEIVKYCKHDAELTLRLANLAMENIENLGYNTKNPISPATISARKQIERGYPVKLTKMQGNELKANIIAMRSYGGGVFATYKRGIFNRKLYDYDVNSCYPNIMQDLPDWRNGEFVAIEEKPETFEYGWILCDVDSEFIPQRGNEQYTVKEIYEGIGEWEMKYTAKKVTYPTGLRTAVITTEEYRWLKSHGEYVKWLDEGYGWVKTSDTYINPFLWVKDMFKKRQEAKKDNPSLAQTMKIMMNSIYGKTAEKKNGIGILTNFCYASYITARARLQMFDVVKENYDIIVNVATDGILSLKPLALSLSPELGAWEYTEYKRGIVIGNGIRQLWLADGSFVTHARGITSDRNYDLEKVMKERRDESFINVGRTRVIQLGTMVNAHIKWKHNDLNSFVMQTREMNVNTDKKRDWQREYKDFGDFLDSEYMDGKPLDVGEVI